MPTIGSITKTIRINPSDLALIEDVMDRDGLSWSGAIHTLINEGGCTPKQSGSDSKSGRSEGVPHKSGDTVAKYQLDEAVLDDLATMQTFMGGSLNEMLRLYDIALNDGTVVYEDGKIIGVPEVDLENFMNRCKELKLDPQKTIDRIVREM